jgi:hypothetical protein
MIHHNIITNDILITKTTNLNYPAERTLLLLEPKYLRHTRVSQEVETNEGGYH